jgi:Tfp pilus assembly protein PilO
MNFKNKFNLIVLILVLLNICLIVFGVYYTWTSINNISQDLISQKEKLINTDLEIQNIEEFKSIYPVIESDLQKASRLLSNYEAPVEFMKFLEDVSLECQVTTNIVALSASQAQEKQSIWPFLPFQIKSSGSFTNFYRFFEKIESGPYLIEIQNLRIDRINDKNINNQVNSDELSVGDVEATILINLFTQKNEVESK